MRTDHERFFLHSKALHARLTTGPNQFWKESLMTVYTALPLFPLEV